MTTQKTTSLGGTSTLDFVGVERALFDSGWRLCFPLVSSVSKSKGEALKKYRVEIFMIRPYDFVDRWPKRPDENDALEAFGHELLTLDADEHFKIEVSEV